MPRTLLTGAVDAWRKAIGGEHVLVQPDELKSYGRNISGLERDIAAVLRPSNTREVQAIVRIANQFNAPLYPVSCGRNWGLGSRLPVQGRAAVVDLGRMDRIREIDVERHYAVVEPGVSQGQMHDFLLRQNLPLLLNVVGAGRGCSLIGNALERGIGYFSSRAHSLSGMEIVLGNGEVIQTGYGHFRGAKTTHTYPHGIGPSLDGLFCQSNFGIVTSAGVDLIPRAEVHVGVIASLLDGSKLSSFIEALAGLRRNGWIQSVIHVPNRSRTETTLGPLVYEVLDDGRLESNALRKKAASYLAAEGFGPWSAVIGLFGNVGQVNLSKRAVRRALGGLAKIVWMSDRRLSVARRMASLLDFLPLFRRKKAILNAIEPLHGLSKGVPTDAPLGSLYWSIGEIPLGGRKEPDQSPCGMLYCLPMMPLSGEIAAETMQACEEICRSRSFDLCVTLNVVDTKTLEAVISVAFDRRQRARVEAAHDCLNEIQEYFIQEGFPPYRVGIQSMWQVVDENDPFWKIARDLKSVFDPNHIIAPGRYNLV